MSQINAKWIWNKLSGDTSYNISIVARKSFSCKTLLSAELIITADSWYRLYINDRWINDGPCRSWPHHYQYDKLNILEYLKPGKNTITVIARYFGTGTFHQVCKHPGLLVQLDMKDSNGKSRQIITDSSWKVADFLSLVKNTPKISIQMEPFEYYDARLENKLVFSKAAEYFSVKNAPWKKLLQRDVKFLTKEPVIPQKFVAANVIEKPQKIYCIPTLRLIYPDLIEANRFVKAAFGIATRINCQEESFLELKDLSWNGNVLKVSVNGKALKNGRAKLEKGDNLVAVFYDDHLTHEREIPFLIEIGCRGRFSNLLDKKYKNPWCLIPFSEYSFADNDIDWYSERDLPLPQQELVCKYRTQINDLLVLSDIDCFVNRIYARAINIPAEKMFLEDIHQSFLARKVKRKGSKLVSFSEDICRDIIVRPSSAGDVELIYDFGIQRCGYYDFELTADKNVIIDIFQTEHIADDGRIQHTRKNRNGMRYIAKEGLNKFTSLKRRSGRYLFITFRNLKKPVKIHKLGFYESTYPVTQKSSFECSNSDLNKIWDISFNALKLCMEDTFTDCPLYEQTLWGDARNESLFAYYTTGATDIADRYIRLSAESLEYAPLVISQVPSAWHNVIPAWSFLWVMAVWEYYWYTGDIGFLKKFWKPVLKNIKNALKCLDSDNLFKAKFWNFFDWSGLDQDGQKILHNSFLLVGAIDAAIKCGKILKDKTDVKFLKKQQDMIKKAIVRQWDNKAKAFPDAISDSGEKSSVKSQHSSFLALLYDVMPPTQRKYALDNLLNPPASMVRAGTPFALMFLFGALEKYGYYSQITQEIIKKYSPMLKAGATTVWEHLPSPDRSYNGFPTRSHCHAWSASPLYYLPRVVLGVKQTKPGCAEFEVSPVRCGLSFAKGSVITPWGIIEVEWKMRQNILHLFVRHPAEVKIKIRDPKNIRVSDESY